MADMSPLGEVLQTAIEVTPAGDIAAQKLLEPDWAAASKAMVVLEERAGLRPVKIEGHDEYGVLVIG